MDFDHQAIGAGGHRGQRHGSHVIAVAGAVAWVDDDGQMAECSNHRNRGEVQSVARARLERADASLAEDDSHAIASGQNIFRGHQEFFDGGREATLEQDRFVGGGDGFQELKILHVARADLKQVGIGGDLLHVGR